jgi:tetratricopeptide (TPR) repeat protein
MLRNTVFAVLVTTLFLFYAPDFSQAQKQRASLVPPPGKSVSFYLGKGGRFLETGNYSQAILYLDAALRAPRKGVKPAIIELAEKLYRSAEIYEQARLLKESGQSESAVEKYRHIIEINPVDPRPVEFIIEIYDLLSEAAEKRNDYEEAARLYECWLMYAPQNDFPRKNLLKNLKIAAEGAEKQGLTDKSIALYQKIARIDPNDPTVSVLEAKLREIEKQRSIGAAEAKLQQGELDGAIADFNSLLTIYPNETRLVEGLRLARGRRTLKEAESLMSARRYHEALNIYQKTTALLPEEKEAVGRRIEEIQLRTGANYSSEGRLRARGSLTGPAKLLITGKSVTYMQGRENIMINLTGNALPSRPFFTKVERVEGDVMVRMVGQPNRSNNYSLALEIVPKSGRSFSFELNWELATSGTVFWRGRVGGQATLWLQGPFIDQTGNVKGVSFGLDPLPHEDYSLKLSKLQGGDTSKTNIIEKPSPSNDFGTAIEITTRADEEVELKMDWTIKRDTKD